MGWESSTRRDGLPRWWPVTVRRIVARDPMCLCTGCPKCVVPGGWNGVTCSRRSKEVDHIIPGDDHRDENLRGICAPCHGHKSSNEGNAAQAEKKKPTGFFDEKHPGRF